MSTIHRILILATGIFALSAAAAVGEVVPASLDNLVRYSDQIVVGKVTNIIPIGGARLAEVQVQSTIKGRAIQKLFFWASPTWACDTSDAKLNELTLLFLESPRHKFNDKSRRSETLTQIIGSSPFFYITWEGRGRLQIERFQNDEYVRFCRSGCNVVFPKSIKGVQIADSARLDSSLAPLSRVLKYIDWRLR